MENKMRQLVDELNAASEAYYGGKAEILTDYEWNAKFDELKALEDATGIVLDDSPTRNVSHEEILGVKETHEFPALSLPKSKSVDDVVRWANNMAVNLSWKLDGMTLVATWDNGILTKLVTRGDGEVGSNITHLVDAIDNVPKTISYKGHLVVRGEAVVSYSDFEDVNASSDTVYDNPRNLVAGSLNPLTSVDNIMDRHIIWLPFTLVHIDDNIVSWRERMMYLSTLGLRTVSYEYMGHGNDLPDAISRWSDNVDNAVYPVDGLVVVYDDTEYASHGTLTGHHDTRGGYAFKWQDESKDSVLLDIEWSVSVQSINPVAIFEGIRLEGTTVRRASLCNISECERLGIGGPGTKVSVIKANKIIPKIIAATSVGEFVVPSVCPVCGSSTRIKFGTSGVKTLVCTNDNCVAKNVSKMSRFVSRHGFDIHGLSAQKLVDLVNKGFIHDFVDILELPNRADEVMTSLVSEDRWGQKSVSNLLSSITKSKTIKAENVLYSLCIPMCGRDIAKKLTKVYSLQDIIKMATYDAHNDTTTVVDGIYGIGEVKASAFISWFGNSDNVDMINQIVSMCNVIDTNIGTTDISNSKVAGLTFVITGSLNHYSSRDVLKDWIENNGGKVVGSVSANTNYLINNDIESKSSKNKKAKELGIEIISEEIFIDKFGE